jgi:hypothetical protein
MNPEVFAEWYRRQGHTIYQTGSSYWNSQGSRVYQAFPYHWVVSPPEKELSDFLTRTGSIGLRYSTPLTAPLGQVSYHAVFEGREYNMDTLGKWARKNVRRGLKFCTVDQVSFQYLAREGRKLQLDTLNRQGRKLAVSTELWQNRCLSAADLPGFEAWGAFVGAELAASVITFQMDDCVYMLYQQCLAQFLPEHVNNALSFTVTQQMVSRPATKSILYGLHSLDAPASVDEFKFRMGYVARPVRQRVVFHPALRPLFNPLSHRLVRKLAGANGGNPTLAKVEGMLRFYLQGRLPLEQQQWPENLLDQKARLLGQDSPIAGDPKIGS